MIIVQVKGNAKEKMQRTFDNQAQVRAKVKEKKRIQKP